MYAARAIFGARRYLIYSPCVLNFALDYNLKSLKRVPAFTQILLVYAFKPQLIATKNI